MKTKMDLSTQLAAIPALDPERQAWQFEGAWRPWSYLSAATAALATTLDATPCASRAVVPPRRPYGDQVGVLMRNRPEIAATAVGLLTTRRCVVTLSPALPVSSTAAELGELRLPAVVVCERDVSPELVAACQRAGTALLAVSEDCERYMIRIELAGDPSVSHALPTPDVAVRMLTSGTTGRPKRVELLFRSPGDRGTVHPPIQPFGR